ncbi:MAG: hypothetical protein D6718_01200 [Acidobacteria bacterium]|nr:MAG: hypothetical protein D6718_01200 [Acidobacteriota bacterium]
MRSPGLMTTAVVGLLLAAACGPPAPIHIGGLIPESGAAAVYGRPIKRGIELAIDEINEAGGVLGGRRIEFECHDTATNGDVAEAAAHELLEKGVPAVIGPATSSVALRLVPIFNEHETILLSPAASSPTLTKEGGDWFFRVYPSDIGEGYRMATFCRDMVLSRVAVVAVKDSFGQGVADVFAEHYKAPTRRIVYRADFEGSLDEASARRIARELAKSRAEAVYIAAYVDDMAALLRAIEKEKVKIARLATSAVTRDLIEAAETAAEGLVFPQTGFDPGAKDPAVQRFVEAYRNRYGEDPDTFAAHGYDAAKVLAAAIEAAKLPAPTQIRSALLNIEYQGVSGRIDFDLNGDVIQQPKLYAVYNGEIVPYEKFREAELGRSILAR